MSERSSSLPAELPSMRSALVVRPIDIIAYRLITGWLAGNERLVSVLYTRDGDDGERRLLAAEFNCRAKFVYADVTMQRLVESCFPRA